MTGWQRAVKLAGCWLCLSVLVANTSKAQLSDELLDNTIISNSFYQTDLTQAIQDVALQAGVNIIVAAQPLFVTDAVFENQTLRTVLDCCWLARD